MDRTEPSRWDGGGSVPRLFLNRQQAAQACGISIDVLTRAIHSGALRAKRSGRNAFGEPAGRYLVSIKALEDWFEQLEDG